MAGAGLIREQEEGKTVISDPNERLGLITGKIGLILITSQARLRHKNYLTCNQTGRAGPCTAGHKCRRFTMGRKDQLIKELFNKETLVMARQ